MMTQTIIVSIVVFTVIILILVGLLLYAKTRLTTSGEVTININSGEKELVVNTGSTLLSSLSNKGVFIPSGCGGGGTCGLCKCQVVEGGGEILPTEEIFFTRREQIDQWRLACQVRVKDNLEIKVPEEVLGVRKWECEVLSNRNVSTYIKELIVKLPDGENLNFRSGGYIQIDVPKFSEIKYSDYNIEEKFHEDWDANKLWDLVAKNPEQTFRAYSMANHPAEGNIIMLNIRIATPPWDRRTNSFQKVDTGICSSYVFSLKEGDKITISGPFGDFFIKDTPNEKMFIGGGAGMAPMRSHIFDLFDTKKTEIPITFWYGARSKREIFYQDDFEKIAKEHPNFRFEIGLSEPKEEDNWKGYTGFIHQVAYDNYLKDHEEPEEIEYYLCGPPAMIGAVMKMLDNLGVPPENILFDDFG